MTRGASAVAAGDGADNARADDIGVDDARPADAGAGSADGAGAEDGRAARATAAADAMFADGRADELGATAVMINTKADVSCAGAGGVWRTRSSAAAAACIVKAAGQPMPSRRAPGALIRVGPNPGSVTAGTAHLHLIS